MSEQPEGTQAANAEEREDFRQFEPRIYVASLSDYNAGRLHGVWLDAAAEPDELDESIAALLRSSAEPAAEEWAIHDYDDFGGIRLGEYESLDTVRAVARGLREHGPAFAGFISYFGTEAAIQADFAAHYRGRWPSVEAFAEDLLDDSGAGEVIDALPDWLRPYVVLDYAAVARDMQLSGDIAVAEDREGVYVYDANV